VKVERSLREVERRSGSGSGWLWVLEEMRKSKGRRRWSGMGFGVVEFRMEFV